MIQNQIDYSYFNFDCDSSSYFEAVRVAIRFSDFLRRSKDDLHYRTSTFFPGFTLNAAYEAWNARKSNFVADSFVAVDRVREQSGASSFLADCHHHGGTWHGRRLFFGHNLSTATSIINGSVNRQGRTSGGFYQYIY